MLKNASPKYDRLAVNYVLSVSDGQISRIEGLDKVREMDCVCNVVQVKFPGTSIQGQGGSAQVIAYVLLVVDDKTALEKTVSSIASQVKIFDQNNTILPLIPFDCSAIPE